MATKQTSVNVQPVKGGSEEHNKREKQLDYVRKDLSHLNQYWESDTQANRLANMGYHQHLLRMLLFNIS